MVAQTDESKARNDASRKHAEHHGEPWTLDELDELCRNWDGTDETLEVIAFCFGRTIEACRQRYYEHVHGHPLAAPIRKPKLRVKGDVVPTFRPGWLFAQCDRCGLTTDVYMDHSGTKTCEDHEEVDA